MALTGQENSLAGGNYFTAFHTRNNTPNAATAVSTGCAFANWSFMLPKFRGQKMSLLNKYRLIFE